MSHSFDWDLKDAGLVTSLELVLRLFQARGTTRESLIEGAKQNIHNEKASTS